MKTSLFIFAAIIIILPGVLTVCDNASKKVERAGTPTADAEMNLNMIKPEVLAELRIYRIKIESDIHENNRSITNIKEKIKTGGMDKMTEYEIKITEFEIENRELKQQIDNFSYINQNEWKEFRKNLDTKMDELNNSIDNFSSVFATTAATY